MDSAFNRQIAATAERGQDLWPLLQGASIFMTGATGFFGRWLLECLARVHDEMGVRFSVLALSRNHAAFLRRHPRVAACPAIAFHHGDVRDFLAPSRRFTHILHGAATAATATFHQTEDPLVKFATSFDGARRTLDLAARSGAEKVLMIGSGSVYGDTPQDEGARIVETHSAGPSPLDTAAAMGHGKRAAEFLCAAYADKYGFDFAIARCFTFIGAHMPLDVHYAVGNFIADALWRDAIVVQGDGSPVRSYMYAGDLTIWLLTMLLKPGPQRIYNVGSDQGLNLAELAGLVRDEICPGKPVRILGQGNGTRNRYVPDISRARADFKLDLWTPLSEAIQITAAAEIEIAQPVDNVKI